MIKIYPYEGLGHADHGWLNARHHFSFADYRNEKRIHFGVLRVINDDIIAAHNGFPPHPHRDMEIITYVRSGAITHKDSMGNEGRTGAGDVQVMSAGTGVTHSEFNIEDEETRLYQIWIFPDKNGVEPRWEAHQFPKEPVKEQLSVLVSGRDDDVKNGALFIHQDAAIYGGVLEKGTQLTQNIKHQAYILVSRGTISIDGETLKKGDGAEITQTKAFEIKALDDAEILVIDVPKN
jgi:redox-sensitive bicupin YhaK (pirin superfamily)